MNNKNLLHLKLQLVQSELYARYWIEFAGSCANISRNVTHGAYGPQLTPEEKIKDGFDTAKVHIQRRQELIDEIFKLINQIERDESNHEKAIDKIIEDEMRGL